MNSPSNKLVMNNLYDKKGVFQHLIHAGLSALIICLVNAGLVAQTFPTPSGFTLPAGKTIVITYDVDVNANACTPGTIPPANLSNQATVTGSFSGSPKLTDDPAFPGATDPTLTPFAGLVIGNLVYNDINRNGVFDGGDTGINGVALNLYLDANSNNMLDAGDGAAVALATTANVSGQDGRYAFSVCPGSYIVQVAPSNFNMGGALFNMGAAFVSSPLSGAGDPDIDLDDNDDNGDAVSGFGVATAAFAISADNNNIDFGFKTPTGIFISNVTMDEGTGGTTTAFNFTVTRTSMEDAINLTVNTTSGTAASPGDFTAISGGTVSFPAGMDPTRTVTVLVNHDNIVETDETFTVVLSGAPAHANITDNSGLGTITNDDNATVTLSADASQDEGNSGSANYTFKATLNNPIQEGFSIAYSTSNNTATAGSDYTSTSGSLSFTGTAGEEQFIQVPILGDMVVELDETFTVALGALTGAPAGVTAGPSLMGTITNDDVATVTINANVVQSESTTPQTFTIILSNPVDVPVTVLANTADGSATTSDNDYTGIVNQLVTFNAGTTTNQLVNVPIINDNKVENNEDYTVNISALSAGGRNVNLGTTTRTGTINNDDLATVTLTGGTSANEGNSGTTSRVFTATLDNPVQGGFALPYTTNDGTATTADNDYLDNDGVLAFAGTMGEVKNISVLVNGDSKVEANETFTLQLGTITGAPAGVSIAGTNQQSSTLFNDEVDWGDGPDSLPTISFYNGARHNTILGFQLGAAIDGETEGQSGLFANGDDTDSDGDDEDGVTLPSVFIAGTMATITVNASAAGKLDAFMDFNWNRMLDDTGEKIFNNVSLNPGDNTLSFLVPSNAVINTSFIRFRFSSFGGLPSGGAATDGEVEDYRVSILNNSYSISSPTVTEGHAGTVNLTYTISRTDNTNAGSVNYSGPTGTATSGTDYQAFAAGTVSFSALGAFSQDFTVTVNGDMLVEDNETVIITLSNPVGGGISTGTGTGIITNDDLATLTLTGGATQDEGNAGPVSYSFTATLDKAVQGGFKVAHTTGAGTATAGTDYVDNDGTLTFLGNIGETKSWTVDVNGDNTVELSETFEGALGAITMTSATQIAAISTLGSPQTSTITNDDSAILSIAANVSQAENITPQAFSLTLSNPVDVGVTVLFNTANNTATTSDNDYTGIVNQLVTFNAGTTTPQTVNVTITNDSKVEPTEVFDVSISSLSEGGRSVSLGTSSRTGSITNDDLATVTLSGGINANEGNTGTTPFVFTATLNNPVQGGFTVPYTTSDGLATTANNDYQDNDGLLTFLGNMGENFQITVPVNGDFVVEANEGFTVQLGAISGAPAGVSVAGSPQSALILNDEIDFGDAPDSYGTLLANTGARHLTSLAVRLGATVDGEADGQPGVLANGDDTDAEGNDDDGVTLPSALVLNTTANISLNASINGFVNAWVDFDLSGSFEAGELIFNQQPVMAGNNALSFTVPAGATVGTSYARFRFTQGALTAVPTGPQTTGEVEDYAVNITNTQFSINDPVAINEGISGTTDLVFTVTRSNTSNPCSVEFSVTGGTATIGDGDFTVITPSPINFMAGGSPMASILVRVNGDTKVELNETVEISLSNPFNGSILDGLGIGTINNDDAATLSITSPTVTEGDGGTQNMTFDLSLSNPSDANVVVNFATMNGTATTADLDYQNNSGTHTFTPGQTTKQVLVLINGDCKIEPNEQLTVQLSALNANGRSVTLSGGGSTLNGTGTINNNDAAPLITCPGPITISCNASQLPANTGMATATDNCSPPPTLGYTDATTPGACVGNYTIARTWKATDNTSDMSTCVQTITVVDNTPPVPVCRTATVSLLGTGLYTLVAADVLNQNASSDNCSDVSVFSISPNLLSCNQLGQTVPVVVLVEDDCGNMAQCTALITVAQSTTLPSGWVSGNIGTNANGSAVYEPCTNGGTFTLGAQGYTTNTSDVQHVAYQTICNNGEIIAHVNSLAPNGGWAGVQMRETSSQGSKKFTIKTQLSTILRREIRTTTFGATNTQQSAISPSHRWFRLVRSGDNFTAYSSADGVNWVFRSAATIVMNSCIQVGLFVESFNNTTTTQATFDQVSISGSSQTLANPPTALGATLMETEYEVSLYPNPATDVLNVDLSSYAGRAVRLEIYSLEGRLLHFAEIQEAQTTEQLNLTTLHKGMYLLKVKSEGLPNVSKRFVLSGS